MAQRFGLVQVEKSGEFYVAEFESNPDQFGVYHIIRAAGPMPWCEVIDDERHVIITEDQISTTIINNDDAEEDGLYLERVGGDLW